MGSPSIRAPRAARGAFLAAIVSYASLASPSEDRPPIWDLKAPAPAIALKPARLEKPEESKCVSCHADVANEWASTAHAIAWIDEAYREQLEDKKKPETCYGCHVPKPLFQGDLRSKPAFRDEDRRLGVTCESCHLGPGGKVLGPRGTPTSAHPSEGADAFTIQRSNALCATCHRFSIGPVVGIAKDFETAKMAERDRSCIGCHTATVEMRFATSGQPGGKDDVPLRKGRSHAIQTPRDPGFLRRAFEFSFAVEGGKTRVSVKNLAGHRVPGLIGRSIEIEVEALDAEKKVLGKGRLVLDAAAYLPVDSSLDVTIDAAAVEVHVIGRHVDPRGTTPVEFVDVRLPSEKR